MQQIEILGIKINNLSFNQAVRMINNFVLLRKPHQICTINPEFIMVAQEDEEFKKILNEADLNVPDGAGLLFVSKYFLQQPLKERVTGTDLVWALAKLAAKRKYPIFLLGAEPGVAEKTAAVLKKEYPDLIIAGTYAGKPRLSRPKVRDFRELRITDIKPGIKDPNFEIIRKVRQAKAKILFVAYGAPKQDKFIARYKKLLNIPVMIGVGGAFDFISGGVSRAPKWMQKLWLEWLWRLFTQPWRLNRIFTATIRFPLAVLKSKFFKHP